MKKLTNFQGKLCQKIVSYLINREGFAMDDMNYTTNGITTTVFDVFGYVYEIEIKMTGRKQNPPENEFEKYMFNAKSGVS
jgi:hypothetical protein